MGNSADSQAPSLGSLLDDEVEVINIRKAPFVRFRPQNKDVPDVYQEFKLLAHNVKKVKSLT